jgi:predicted MFS family arabinose efflux permease
MVKPYLVDRGFTMEDVGWMLGVLGSGMGLCGALLGGHLVGRLGRRRALLLFGALQIMTMLVYAGSTWADPRLVWLAVGSEHLVSGMATVSLFTAMMDTCRPGHAGTDYTVQASVVVIAQGLGAAVSGWFAEALGWGPFFGLSAVLCVGAVLVVARHRAPRPFGWVA